MSIINRFVKSELLTYLFRGAAIALSLQLSGIAITYTMQVLLARWMGATQYGVYDYVISIGTFLGFLAALGLPSCLLRFIPEYSVKEDWGKLRGIVWGSWRYVLISSILFTLIGSGIIISWNRQNSEIALVSFLLGISTIPLWALVRHQREMSRGIKRMTLAYMPSSVMFPLLVIGGAFYYRDRLSSSIAIAITFLSLSLILLSQLWLFNRQLPKQCAIIEPIYSRREWFAVAIPLLFNDGAFVVLSQTDTIMTGAILGSFHVGLYSAAFKTAAGVSFILAAVNAIAAPMFATLHAQGDSQGLQKLTATVAQWMFYPTLVCALLLIFFGERVLGLFGDEFIAARWSMTVLILGQLVNVGAGSVGYLMEMTGHHKQCAYVLGCSAVLNLVLNGILIPTLGIMGAAIATASTMALWNRWLHQLVVKYLGVKPSIISIFR
ncbi:oligosaccharide flippase family protein [Pleurocapsa sp. PCC 7319]|uniref:oligosaccharide flippase family protein n=1 Tax=Pleurocapsa sp. PCC 7319 TaxID=118161 RepID=UPI00034BE6B4|nr:oligosaccharide flippase family protein [Pleurocapsa sp. PCC 7319]